MFDLMGAIRKRQQAQMPQPADSAETAESPQLWAEDLAEDLRKIADTPKSGNFSAIIRSSPHTPKASDTPKTGLVQIFSANPPNPQTSEGKLQHNPYVMLEEIAKKMQADAHLLRTLLSDDDMQAVADGEYSRGLLVAYFRQMVRNGTSLTDPRGQLEPRTRESMEISVTESAEQTVRKQAWQADHESFMNHLMSCRACHAPRNCYCREGAKLRGIYLLTYELAKQTTLLSRNNASLS